VNVASGEAIAAFDVDLGTVVESCKPCPAGSETLQDAVSAHFDSKPADVASATVRVDSWTLHRNFFFPNRGGAGELSLALPDEGRQQEQLGNWLVDSLQLQGAVINPEIDEPSGRRELTDILFSYPYGAFLIESKTLAILGRRSLPSRARLQKTLEAHAHKAIGQLTGAINNIKRGYNIFDPEGNAVAIERNEPAHGVILVPDLSLLAAFTDFKALAIQFMEKTGGFIHVLDIAELLRVVQAAEKLASLGKTTTPMMAFDYYLIERAKYSERQDTPYFQVLLRVQDAPNT
jgi:hypothetical protein